MSTETTPPMQIVQGNLAAQAHARLVASVHEHERCNYEFASPQEILNFDSDMRDAGIPIRRWVLGDPEQPLATAFCFRATWNTPRHTFWGHIRVAHGHTGHGYGTTLLHSMERWAQAAGGQMLRLMAQPSDRHARFLQTNGYDHIGTEQLFALPLAAVSPRPPVVTAPVTVLPLAAYMQHEADAMEQACQLHAAISLDVPMPDEPVVTLSKFRRLVGEFVDPAHFLVAVHDGMLVGEAILVASDTEPDVMWQHATGVLPAYRGMGIATALKHAAIASARACGMGEMRTWMETSNTAMMQINKEFGFVPMRTPGSTVHLYGRTFKNAAAFRC